MSEIHIQIAGQVASNFEFEYTSNLTYSQMYSLLIGSAKLESEGLASRSHRSSRPEAAP